MKDWYRFDVRPLVLVVLCAVAPQICHAEDFGASPLPTSFQYYRYSGGHIVQQRAVRRGDRVYDALISFLRGHRTNWVVDVTTYAPLLYFRSRYLTVNCRDDDAIVNYKDKKSGRWRQLSNSAAGCAKALLD
jgi:hypothetical protein